MVAPVRKVGAFVWLLCLANVALHVALARRYDYHRDELYFIACGRHLASGYVDHAPLVPWIAALAGVFHHDLVALRLLPALAGGATVWLTAHLARELEARDGAVAMAAVAVTFCPAYLRMSAILCIPVFEAPLWTLASLLVVRIARGADPTARRRLWLAVGAVAGVGLLNKHSMLLWIAGLAVGVVATPLRRELRTLAPWLGAAVAALLAAPNLVWQAQHGWATVEFLRALSSSVLVLVPRSLFLAGQLVYVHPLAAPIWIAGLVWLLRSERGRPFRALGWSFLVVAAILLATHAKPYYLAPAYPPLVAAGVVALDEALHLEGWRSRVVSGALAATGVALALVALPILPLDRIDRAVGAVGSIVRPENLTGELHDQFGWREQVDVAAGVVAGLSADERRGAVVLAGNYGQAGAVDFFGPERGLVVMSGHMTYWMWGPITDRTGPVVAYGLERARLDALFADVREVARIDHPLAWPGERDLPVFLCRSPRGPLAGAWPSLERHDHATPMLEPGRR